MSFADINFVAILVATIAQMAIGFVWYSPGVFGSAWMKHVGLTQKDAENGAGSAMLQGVASTLIATYFLAVLVGALGLSTPKEVFCATLVLSLSTLIPLELNNVIWGRGPIGLFYINAGHAVVSLFAAALVLVMW